MENMLGNTKRVFVAIIVLFFLLVLVDIPQQFPIAFSLFGVPVKTELNPPTLSFRIFGTTVQKEFRTHLGLDLSGGTHVVLEAEMEGIKSEERMDALDSARQVIERRVNFFGVSEPTVVSARSADRYRIIVELPGVTDVDRAIETIGQTAQLELREFTDEEAATGAAAVIPSFTNTKTASISGRDLRRAQLSFSSETGEAQVALEFTPDGAKKFADATTRLKGKHLPIFLDDTALTWPRVEGPITDGKAVITGGFTTERARILALQLNAGALPVPVSVVEKRTIGATLGAASVQKSVRAGVIGLALVAVFMIGQYGWLGVIADGALLLYGLLTFAIFRWIPITLTLPGIAGFLLSIGMAVDSNILIFERLKEELRRGKPWHIAMELGFGKAWDSIRDANITTLLTCLILYNPGNWQMLSSSGMVRGFAVTLFIGVLTSLFTGIVVTRTLIRVLYRRRQ